MMVLTTDACAQVTAPDAAHTPQAVAADEDWSFLANPALRVDARDRLEYIPLWSEGAYVSIGAEFRAFYEGFHNESYGALSGTSNYGKGRILLHGDIHPDPNWRVFGELQSSSLGARPGGPRPTIDKDTLDLLEGFVEWHSTDQDPQLQAPSLVLRVGRQEPDFGAGRVFSSCASADGEGPSLLQGMDVARLIWRTGPWRLDVFGGRPVQDNQGVFDDGSAPGQGAWGAYLTP